MLMISSNVHAEPLLDALAFPFIVEIDSCKVTTMTMPCTTKTMHIRIP